MLTRRTFVKIGSGLVAFVPTTKALAALPELPTQPQAAPKLPAGFEPRYATGVVAAVKPGEILLRTTYRGDVRLQLAHASYIWKGEVNPKAPIEPGDTVHAWGQPQESDALAIEKMWVNIVNLRGPIFRVQEMTDGARFQLVDGRQGVYLVNLSPSTIVHRIDQAETTYSRASMPLRDDQQLQVIGLKLPGRTVRGTRVFVGG